MSSPTYEGLTIPKPNSRAQKLHVGFSSLYAKRKSGRRSRARVNPETPRSASGAVSAGGAYPEYPFQ